MTEFIRYFPERRCGCSRQCMNPGAMRKEAGMDLSPGVAKNIFPLLKIASEIDISKQGRRKTENIVP